MNWRLHLSLTAFLALAACSNGGGTSAQPTVVQPTVVQPTVVQSTVAAVPTSTPPTEQGPNPPAGIESASDGFGLVMGWLAYEELPESEYEAVFGVAFRAQVSYGQFVSLLGQLGEAGPWTSVESQVETETEVATVIESAAEGAERLLVQVIVYGGRINTLFFGPAEPFEPPGTVEAAVARLEKMGTLRYAVFDRSGGTCEVVSGQGSDEPMQLGSVFKLYVLFAIQLAVDAGDLNWADPVTIRDELDSFPSGTTQDVEPGTTLTVRKLAELMISISDNTATDHLMDLIGRDAVEAAVASVGHATPELLTPFLNTRELFVLKTVFTQAERQAYIAAGSDARREILDQTVAETPLGPLADIAWTGPIDIDTLEWFGSPADVCRVVSALASTPETREILAINPGVDAGGRWDYVGFKGGSEPGVLAVSWYVESSSKGSYVVAGSVINTNSALDEAEAINLFATIRDLVGAG